jgi:uncharacterized protein YozE (UPF0346 family)
MGNSTKHKLRLNKKNTTRTKRKGGNRDITKKQINMVFENMHTSNKDDPKYNIRIQVYSDTPIPKSALDFYALSQLFGSYTADVDEQLSLIKDGPVKPPKIERIIKASVKDNKGSITKKQVRILFENRRTSNKKYNIHIQVYSDNFIPKSAYDMNTLSKLTDYYMATIDEQLSLIKDGPVKPPRTERIITVLAKDKK